MSDIIHSSFLSPENIPIPFHEGKYELDKAKQVWDANAKHVTQEAKVTPIYEITADGLELARYLITFTNGEKPCCIRLPQKDAEAKVSYLEDRETNNQGLIMPIYDIEKACTQVKFDHKTFIQSKTPKSKQQHIVESILRIVFWFLGNSPGFQQIKQVIFGGNAPHIPQEHLEPIEQKIK